MSERNLDIKQHIKSDVSVWELHGVLDQDTHGVLKQFEHRHSENVSGKLIIDLRDLLFIDSSGIGKLYEIHANLKNRGLKMTIRATASLVEVFRKYKVFETFDFEPSS